MNKLMCACLLLCLPLLAVAEPDTEALERRLLEAQSQLGELAREIAEINRELGISGGQRPARARAMMHHRSESPRPPGRRQLGLLLTSADSDQGLTVVGLTPAGPAQAAGLARGDLLLAINGQSLAGRNAADVARLVQATAIDEPVVLEVQRGEERMDIEVMRRPAGRADVARLGDVDFDALAEWGRVLAESLKENLGDSLGESLGEMDLSDLLAWVEAGRQRPGMFAMRLPYLPGTGLLPGRLIANHEGLAPYFGTGEGVLVLDVRADNLWDLAAGDVILRVADEPVNRPADIARQLRASETDVVDIEIMRAGTIERLTVATAWRD